MAAQDNIRALDLYQVEYTRLDEQEVLSWNVAVAPGQTEIQAIEKGEKLFLAHAKAQPTPFVLATIDEARDNEYRRNAKQNLTYWRNRCSKAGEAFF